MLYFEYKGTEKVKWNGKRDISQKQLHCIGQWLDNNIFAKRERNFSHNINQSSVGPVPKNQTPIEHLIVFILFIFYFFAIILGVLIVSRHLCQVFFFFLNSWCCRWVDVSCIYDFCKWWCTVCWMQPTPFIKAFVNHKSFVFVSHRTLTQK